MLRKRHLLIPLLALFLLLLILARHHLQSLAEVARTFATFYPYITHHPKTLYRYSLNATQQPAGHEDLPTIVPPIIHQILLTEGRNTSLTKYEEAIVSCQQFHPNWTHNIWTDDEASNFIAQHYTEVWSHYRHYKQSIQRANILRYALLDHFGGIYLDLDVRCLQSLDDLRHLPWLTPGAYPAGVNNAFILAKPHHTFAKHLLDGVESRDLSWGLPYIDNMLSTGCMFFTNMWMSYVRMLSRMSKSTAGVGEYDPVYILADENGNMDPHMLRGAVTTPLFKHGGASSWHSWDAAVIVLIGKHYCIALVLFVLGALFAVAALWSCLGGESPRLGYVSCRRWKTSRLAKRNEAFASGGNDC